MRTPDLRRMIAYLDWSNGVTLAAAGDLQKPVLTADVGASFTSILGTLRHMEWAEQLWFARWTRGADPQGYASPSELPGLAASWRALAAERRVWVDALADDAAEGTVTYTHPADGPQRAILGDLVQHAVDHATFHRGQVIGMMRQAGVAPPATSLRRYLSRPR
jgi:uncharacterized damage-inducible protein DinB